MTLASPFQFLALDTATSWQTVALLRDDQVLAQIEQNAEGSHARSLMPAIHRILKGAGLSLRDLQGVALSIGPGSFTGLRVGLATLLGFRAVLGVPIVPVPTLEAMAWNLRQSPGRLIPVIKSRRNEVYWAAYEWSSGGRLRTCIAEQVGSPASVVRAVEQGRVCTVFGDGWLAYEQDIREAWGQAGVCNGPCAPEVHRPSAVSVALAARERLLAGQIADSTVAPRYVQRTEAEVMFDALQEQSPLERRRQRIARKLGAGKGGVGRTR
ncbi:tRNA (adenosine(37)-N6)-threonylcarbamoyltransferase complex dimerization subunit type 1 TsaB [Nitrospirales bacterium NOB]|nr:hypothetical protein [Nitrospirota bacterium]MCE7964390.1 tRNA (adenosine(37)-N6)-threonylcarbamoyltransferase complex dimerization subunit type 1 TsaB [Nitrospira sp. NTP2]MCK6500377.1 tRNA (adenosine(37)-N6)-threonylcarbamoyltransferase complex dimerization subunit type 1 TsaB [Nitrospira sp.]MDL1890809.1 tRNA (adenosine(37)-N6)-threonylcarbamoyltransferase complex dimerization subunit type 1 TsaB [Nitrospirales bacterium NOB]MEB2339771.1 tRNA (adenosine(37)-N6)-threonylcarbamoyltransferas